ncbi:MAG: recombinase family protein [Maritimibacter sp.]|nr:recombinase family protein [Maritimibacter sp.]
MIAAIYHNTNVTPDNGQFDRTRGLAIQVCTDQGLALGPTYWDIGSGRRSDRPALASTLNAARAGQFDVLLLGAPYALSRDIPHLFEILGRLEASGVAVYDLGSMAKLETRVPKGFRDDLDRTFTRERKRRARACRGARQ